MKLTKDNHLASLETRNAINSIFDIFYSSPLLKTINHLNGHVISTMQLPDQPHVKSLLIEPKLSGQMNYPKWVFKMTILLKAANLWEQDTNLPIDTSVSLHAILSNVEDGVSDLLLDCITASSAWSLLKEK